jgi:hypothetical protein
LHDFLFQILKQIPNDATFNQSASVDRVKVKLKRAKCSFGYDLSAATDRLPLKLQISVLTSLFDAEFSKHWADLLVYNRPYLYKEQLLTYAVGQPMGALSS